MRFGELRRGGAAGPDLEPAAAYCMRVAGHVDEAAMVISRRLRGYDGLIPVLANKTTRREAIG